MWGRILRKSGKKYHFLLLSEKCLHCCWDSRLSNISKTSASVSSGVPNTEKVMKAAECFYCFEVFGTPEETRDDGRRRWPLATISAQILHVICQNECECFIIGYKHRESNENTRPQAECFYCFEVFGTPDETRSTSFWYGFSNETIGNYAVTFFSQTKQ